MAANTSPIFTKTPDIQWAAVMTAANTAMDGTGTVTTLFTADATEGGYVNFVKLSPVGSNIQTVARLWINNGATNATATNNTLFAEVTLPATTASANSALFPVVIPVEMPLNPGYKLNMTLGTAVAAGYLPVTSGGKY